MWLKSKQVGNFGFGRLDGRKFNNPWIAEKMKIGAKTQIRRGYIIYTYIYIELYRLLEMT